MSGHPMSIKYREDTHVLYVSLSPLVEPDIGFSPVRLSDGTRHSFASQLVNKGKSLEIIGEILGHSNTQTTKKYSHLSIDAMRDAMEK